MKLIVETFGEIGKIPNLAELMPEENRIVGELKREGVVEQLFLKDGAKGAFFVCGETDKTKVDAALQRLPFYPHFDKIEMTLVKEFEWPKA